MPAADVRPSSATQRALLLDFDGTLADTLPGLRAVYAAFLAKIGADGRAPHFNDANGVDLSVLIPDLCRQFAPQEDPQRAWTTYWTDVEAAILSSPPASGAQALMHWARSQGWRLGIASAGRTGLIAAWLAKYGMTAFIDDVVGADICERGKPDPLPYRLLMEHLGTRPQDSIAIEDSATGVASARGAGVDVIRLNHDTTNPAGDTACEVASLDGALHYLTSRFERTRIS